MEGLPPDSALHRSITEWTTEKELAALLVEKTDQRLYDLAVMWADDKSKKKIPTPITITHPDRPVPEPRPRKKTSSPAEIARLLGSA